MGGTLASEPMVAVKTIAIFFPFDLFGSTGSGSGARLLADALREMLDDNRREKLATRARAYQDRIRIREFTFDRLADYQDWRSAARQAVRQALQRREFLLWITGNHLGVLPVYDEMSATSSETTLAVQFDAHLDIYNLSDCTTELSHGNFLLHAEKPLPALINVGSRELLLRPEYVGRYYQDVFSAAGVAIDAEAAVHRLREAAGRASRIFIDIDCDVFDPAYFPAVSHPLPFGLNPAMLLRFLDAVWSERVVGVAISEFDPARDRNDQSLSTLVWLLEYLLLKRHEKG